jgi:periplasmic divalent cation tolerance protein
VSATRQYITLMLTCADAQEASTIAKALLEDQLIVCAKQLPVAADFRWEGAIDHNEEIMLLMDSAADLFELVEAKVEELHSYDTIVLQALPLLYVSTKARTWMQENLRAPA